LLPGKRLQRRQVYETAEHEKIKGKKVEKRKRKFELYSQKEGQLVTEGQMRSKQSHPRLNKGRGKGGTYLSWKTDGRKTGQKP